MYKFSLYITAKTPRSERLTRKINKLLAEEFDAKYSLSVISVLDNPQVAVNDNILATPTLTKTHPEPVRRIIGDLDKKNKILYGLEL